MTTAVRPTDVVCPTCAAKEGVPCTLRAGETLTGAYASAAGRDVDAMLVAHPLRHALAVGEWIARKMSADHADELPTGARFVFALDGG